MNSLSLLIFGFQHPEPDSTGAGVRMLQLISVFQSEGFKVYFATASHQNQYSISLKDLEIPIYNVQLNDTSTDLVLKMLQPDVILFDRFVTEEQYGWKVDEICPNALKILDTEDLHFLREKREIELNKNHKNEDLLSDKAKRELAAMYRCDLSLIISKFEFNYLVNTFDFPESLLVYLPFLINRNPEEYLLDYSERKHFVSIGNFKHKPNHDMVVYTYKHIWPLLKQRIPDAEWHIYGAYLPPAIASLNSSTKAVIVKGRASNATKTLKQYRLMLAYLRFGAGLKQKCIDSMLAGTPICTTSIGAEGLLIGKEWAGIIEDDIENYIKQTHNLYAFESKWQKCQNNGFTILDANFSRSLFVKDFIHLLHRVLDGLPSYRNDNITGQLLKYHMYKSTKYMSLWIQAKNKTDVS